VAWCVYLLECVDGHYYVGHSGNLDARFAAHRAGLGADFTRRHPPLRIAYVEGASDEESAVRRENQLKRWSRAKKLALLSGRLDEVHQLAQRRNR